jgi:hypothetical protein
MYWFMPQWQPPRRTDDVKVRVENDDGQWVPAIPEPLHGVPFLRCWTCKAKFLRKRSYRGHYALVHILKLGPNG